MNSFHSLPHRVLTTVASHLVSPLIQTPTLTNNQRWEFLFPSPTLSHDKMSVMFYSVSSMSLSRADRNASEMASFCRRKGGRLAWLCAALLVLVFPAMTRRRCLKKAFSSQAPRVMNCIVSHDEMRTENLAWKTILHRSIKSSCAEMAVYSSHGHSGFQLEDKDWKMSTSLSL